MNKNARNSRWNGLKAIWVKIKWVCWLGNIEILEMHTLYNFRSFPSAALYMVNSARLYLSIYNMLC